MTGIFDTHLHLAADLDSQAFLDEARAAGVTRFLLAGTDREDIPRYAALAAANPDVCYTAGLHPLDCENTGPEDVALVRRHLLDGAVAVGEIGLDNHYAAETAAEQERVFAAMLGLAAETGLPVQIHCREAFDRCHAMVRECLPAGHRIIIHSFTDGVAEARQWLDLGAYLGYNGMVTFRKADNIRETLAFVPLDRLLVETDSPYLAPVPYRGHPNTPAYLPAVVERIAAERQRAPEEIIALTRENGERVFGLQGIQ